MRCELIRALTTIPVAKVMHRGHLGAIERAFVWFESVLEWPMIDVRYDLTARDVNIIHVTAQLYLLISVNHSHCQSIVLMFLTHRPVALCLAYANVKHHDKHDDGCYTSQKWRWRCL